ncbi:hypothetical protein Ciccas_003837 [Cichlidogyrus casuarinus]|uniref:Uncharacterized protein n=1 Tax=Cichlidogyrus casuarinus TaxID=1844966 RepID=A0ABD2QE55_9PLAT
MNDVDQKGAASLLKYLSLANTIGRAGAGIVSDLPFINPIWLNNFALVLGGTVLIFIPLMQTYSGLMAMAVIYGGIIGSAILLSGIMCMPLMCLSRWENNPKNRDASVLGLFSAMCCRCGSKDVEAKE